MSFGYADAYNAHYAASVRALDEKALADAARGFIRPEEVVWVIVGDLAKVEAGIRSLTLGEVVRLYASSRLRRPSEPRRQP